MSCIERALPLLETNNGRYGHGPIIKYDYGLHHTGDRSYVIVLRDSSRTEQIIVHSLLILDEAVKFCYALLVLFGN